MEEQEFVVSQTKQIAVKAVNQEEAFKKALNGEGVVAGMSMACSPRPQQGTQTSGQFPKTATAKVNG